MNPDNLSSAPGVSRGITVILASGFLFGVIDFIAASVQTGGGPVLTGKIVASVLVGGVAFNGGAWPVVLGVAMHFAVAMTVAAIFYGLSLRWPTLLQHAVPAGVLYGLGVFAVMNYGVLPLLSWLRSLYLHTAVSLKGPMGWPQVIIHVFFVGLPLALLQRWLTRRASGATAT